MHIFHGVGHVPNAQIPDRLTDLLVRFANTFLDTAALPTN